MAVIQVTPETLRSKAADVRNYRSEHNDVMAKLKNLIYALNEIWKGDAQNAFLAKYESMQPTFTNFSELLEGYAKLMDTAANELEATDQSLKSTMDNFG
ncbi:MAG: WXG100 family type VII secretion target [Lachnospiraceae bacterium]|nr:WXG100 family type VII secretion target [Lachnospiraceae bacterium]